MALFVGSEDEALERLSTYTAADKDPDAPLDEDELAMLLQDARRYDAGGLAPWDPAWTPTYNLAAAAAGGWDIKAAKVATATSTRDLDGDRQEDDWKFQNCQQKYRDWAQRAAGQGGEGPGVGDHAAVGDIGTGKAFVE